MTRLELAIEKLKHFPKKQQNLFAAMVLDEALWNASFARTSHKIDTLGKSVLAEIKAGKFTKISR